MLAGVTAVQLVTPSPVEARSHVLQPTTSMLLRQLAQWSERSPLPRSLPTLASPENDARSRPAVLAVLYGSFAALQALDVHSTKNALAHGYTESNPLLEPVSRNMPTMLAVKAGATLGTILIVERLWKRNRAAAVATMIGLNVGYGLVVGGNYRRARAAP
jgi:Domain of unknown function (DUF5658)